MKILKMLLLLGCIAPAWNMQSMQTDLDGEVIVRKKQTIKTSNDCTLDYGAILEKKNLYNRESQTIKTERRTLFTWLKEKLPQNTRFHIYSNFDHNPAYTESLLENPIRIDTSFVKDTQSGEIETHCHLDYRYHENEIIPIIAGEYENKIKKLENENTMFRTETIKLLKKNTDLAKQQEEELARLRSKELRKITENKVIAATKENNDKLIREKRDLTDLNTALNKRLMNIQNRAIPCFVVGAFLLGHLLTKIYSDFCPKW